MGVRGEGGKWRGGRRDREEKGEGEGYGYGFIMSDK